MQLLSKIVPSSEILLIFPHQLFKDHTVFNKGLPIIMMEEYLFFSQYSFHKKKLVLHRASMKAWQAEKEKQGYAIEYFEAAANELHDVRKWIKHAAQNGLHTLHVIDPEDYWLKKRIIQSCAENNVAVKWYGSPNF
jgi:deoxyribodipyrimidine photolyase-related protein